MTEPKPLDPCRVLICGSRNWTDRGVIATVINTLTPDTVVIHGAARGADTIAGELATARGLQVLRFPADWKRYGRAAGPIRNKQMLVEGDPCRIVAFPLRKSGGGTWNMIHQAKAAGVPVQIVQREKTK